MFDKLIKYLETLGSIRSTERGVSIMKPNAFDEAKLSALCDGANLSYIYNPSSTEFSPSEQRMVSKPARLFVGKISGGMDATQTANHLANLK